MYAIRSYYANPTITVNDITDPTNTIDFIEAKGMITISGSVGGEAEANDPISLTLSGTDPTTGAYDHTYNGFVAADGSFSFEVSGAELAYDTDKLIDLSVTATDDAGNTGVPNPPVQQSYNVDITNPKFNAALYTSSEYKLIV